MKKSLFVTTLIIILSWTHIAAQNPAPSSGVEISFTFNRQRGFSSNQFAVWIEDSGGRVVKTLFATKFTASGGWAKRPLSIPLWVEKSGLSSMAKKDIDAFTGATPRAGVLRYLWDGKDKNGTTVAEGEYKVFLEATLREDDRVIYSASFRQGSGSSAEAETKTTYFGSRTNERGMIENVKVLYRP